MKLIRNAITYKVSLPAVTALAEHLTERLHSEILPNQLASHGFQPNPTTAELVTPIEGGLAFDWRFDSKILPAAAIRTEVDKKVAEIEQAEGRKIGRKERSTIKDEVLFTLCQRALVSSSVVSAFYQAEEQLLILATGSKKLADLLMADLLHAVGSITSQTIHISGIKHGLTSRLTHTLASDASLFDGLHLGGYVQLAQGGEKVSYDLESLVDAADSILDRLNSGFEVTRLGFGDGAINFRLTADFHLRSIHFDYEVQEGDDWDAAYLWRHEAGVQLLLVVRVLKTLMDLLEYQEAPVAAEQPAEEQLDAFAGTPTTAD